MTTSLETEFHQRVSKQKQIFTDEKIKDINKHTRPIQILLDQATEDGFIHNVKVDGDEVKKINIKEVHPPCKKIKKWDVPLKEFNGMGKPNYEEVSTLQTRAKIEIKEDSKKKIQDDIRKDRWDSHALQIILFKLPKRYQYQDKDGTWVIYGILNGNHRVKACLEEFQDFIPAWVTEIDFPYLHKIANNIFNSTNSTNVPLTYEDHGNRIVLEIKQKETTFSKRFWACKTNDAKEQCVRDEIKEIPNNTFAIRTNVERYVQQNCKDEDGKKIYIESSTIMNQADAHIDTFAKIPDAVESSTKEPHNYHTLSDNGSSKKELWILIQSKSNNHLDAADKIKRCIHEEKITPTVIINTTTTVANDHDNDAKNFKDDIMKVFSLDKKFWKSKEFTPQIRFLRIAKTSADSEYCKENFQEFIDVE